MLLPLALAQFIASYAGSNMNVAITNIASDLGTTVQGVQLTITLFTLVMAALMIPGSKLTDIWGRKRCFIIGMTIYGIGALVATLSRNLTTLIVGYSFLEGIGSALMIPPVYILVTVSFSEARARAKAFGIISAMAGIGAAAGPLIGGFITSAVSWRASFILQVLVVGLIILLAIKIVDPPSEVENAKFDYLGAITSAAGLFFIVLGILQAGTYGWTSGIVWLLVVIGFAILGLFYLNISRREKKGKEPLLPVHLFKNRTSNLGLVTQNIQWLIMQGSFFVISVALQTVRGYSAIQTGLILSMATLGLLISSGSSKRLVKKYARPLLIRWGFIITLAGMALLLILTRVTANIYLFLPGLFLIGVGIGVMLTFSVDVVQSSFPEKDQGAISGLSRSVSNLGSSLGVAIVGTVLVTTAIPIDKTYNLALLTMLVIGFLGLTAAFFIPNPKKSEPVIK